jgi:hypothetical protein
MNYNMSVLLLHFKTAWNDHFPGTSPLTTLYLQEYSQKQTPSVANVYVSNCLFRSITSTSDGGALFLSTSVSFLVVESSSFFTCKSSSNRGGAILFINTNSGQCVFYAVCGYDCSAPNYNSMFSRVEMYNAASSKNYVNYSSISRCDDLGSGSWYILCHLYGKICFPSFNISMNKCYRRLVYYHPYSDSNSVIYSLSYSSFADNYVTSYNTIGLYNSAAKYEIKCCNIIRNTQGTLGTEGTIYTTGNTFINDSCILENNANYIFYATSSSYTITLSNCTLDSYSSYGNVKTQNTLTKSFILALNHLSTRNCYSEYDTARTLTPVIHSSNKQKLCCTCGKFFYQPHLGDFVSLMWVFIFNFIYSGPSGDP